MGARGRAPGDGAPPVTEGPPTRYFDSHSHVQDDAFDDDRDEALERAAAAGVTEIVAVGADPESAERARALASLTGPEEPAAPSGPAGSAAESVASPSAKPRVYYTAGLHPHDASRWSPGIRDSILDHLAHGAVAIGETGLDYHYLNSPEERQREAFAAQLAMAAERDAPVVIHSRDAEEETLAILADSDVAPERVVLHCFSSSASMLAEGVERGYYVSFSGMVTFRKFPSEELVPLVPRDRLLAETDAPYLAPVPHRGGRNEPAFVVRTVERLAEITGVEVEEMAARTGDNARRFYGLRTQRA